MGNGVVWYNTTMKSWGYSLVLSMLRSLIYVKRSFLWLGKWMGIIISPVFRLLGRRIVFPIFSSFVRFSKRRSRMKERYGAFKGMVRGKGIAYLQIVMVVGFVGLFFGETQVFAGEPVAQNSPLARVASYNPYNEAEFGEIVQEGEGLGGYTPLAGGRLIIAPFGTIGVNSTDISSASKGDRKKIISHVVEKGDTLGSIAQRYSISLNTLLWENGFTARTTLSIGDVVRILPFDGVTYKVTKGDTVAGIAKKFGIEGAKIAEANSIDNSQVFVGEILFIPDAKPLTTAIAKKPTNGTKPSSGGTVVTPPVSVARPNDAGTRLLWPTSGRVITQYYGGKHTGVDIDGDYDSPIYASEDGVVVKSEWNANGYGYYVVIDHGGGMQTLYAHTSKRFVEAGEQVTRGQVIAMVGTTGRSTGTHLHYEVRINNKRFNPLSYTR